MFKYALLSNSTGCPDNYARIVNVSSDVHRYGTIVFDNLNDRYELDLHVTLVKRTDHTFTNYSINIYYSGGYCPYGAYQQSKLANILFTYELQRRLLAEGCHVTANALHPGISNTDLFQNVPSLIRTAQNYIMSWMFKVI